jgi:hypothetical protein
MISFTDSELTEAKRIWEEYQANHDLSDRIGQAAGIDPHSGQVWIGKSAIEIVEQRRKRQLDSPLFFERVGYPTYLRKGGRR